ncbi:hypothetical protein [Micropruina glycogenica]|uniref:Lipoprotein n=1 Tax=Micropruina glycogenica TaxID=75385 RepID=A0A2N9JE94_9ACTN|nr:hypothetical protein [Micropruina glycogenica]SPD85849.1 exported protein of unknown function [Micropruina glycogenica]
MSIARLRTAAVASAAIVALVGCTATPVVPPSSEVPSATSSPTPSGSPTPASSWSAEQQAAIDAVHGYSETSLRIGADPSKYTEAQMRAEFKKYLGGDMVPNNVGAMMTLKKKGWHYEGDVRVLSLNATKAVDNHSERGLEVHVTVCRDQSAIRVADKSGNLANTDQPPKFNLRQYSVRKPAGSHTWRVYGIATVDGRCGS